MKLKLLLGFAGSAFFFINASGVMAYPVNSQGFIDIETVKKHEDLTSFADCSIIHFRTLECDTFSSQKKKQVTRKTNERIDLDYCSPGTLVMTKSGYMKCDLNTGAISGSFLKTCIVDGVFSDGHKKSSQLHVSCKGEKRKGRLVGLLGDGKSYTGHYIPAKRKRKHWHYPYELYINPGFCSSKTYWNDKGILRCAGK
jgi:hypothetical protein